MEPHIKQKIVSLTLLLILYSFTQAISSSKFNKQKFKTRIPIAIKALENNVNNNQAPETKIYLAYRSFMGELDNQPELAEQAIQFITASAQKGITTSESLQSASSSLQKLKKIIDQITNSIAQNKNQSPTISIPNVITNVINNNKADLELIQKEIEKNRNQVASVHFNWPWSSADKQIAKDIFIGSDKKNGLAQWMILIIDTFLKAQTVHQAQQAPSTIPEAPPAPELKPLSSPITKTPEQTEIPEAPPVSSVSPTAFQKKEPKKPIPKITPTTDLPQPSTPSIAKPGTSLQETLQKTKRGLRKAPETIKAPQQQPQTPFELLQASLIERRKNLKENEDNDTHNTDETEEEWD